MLCSVPLHLPYSSTPLLEASSLLLYSFVFSPFLSLSSSSSLSLLFSSSPLNPHSLPVQTCGHPDSSRLIMDSYTVVRWRRHGRATASPGGTGTACARSENSASSIQSPSKPVQRWNPTAVARSRGDAIGICLSAPAEMVAGRRHPWTARVKVCGLLERGGA